MSRSNVSMMNCSELIESCLLVIRPSPLFVPLEEKGDEEEIVVVVVDVLTAPVFPRDL